MEKLVVSYNTIKQILTTIPSYYVQQGNGGYDLFAIGEVLRIFCKLGSDETSNISDFETNLKSGCTAVSSPADAIVLGNIANNVPFVTPKDANGIALTISEPRTGSEVVYATHNFCDPVSWFGDSIRVNDQVLTDIGDGYSFTSPNVNWIDMISGRVLDDDGLIAEQMAANPSDPHGYQVLVSVDGYAKTMRTPFETTGGDYEVYWDDGYINFFESQSGKSVLASYSYADGSTFYVRPYPDKTLSIEAAEADFSSDIVQNDTIEYSVWGYVDVFAPQYLQANGGPYPPGTKIPIKTGYYKRYTQILREAVGSFPTLSPNGCAPEHMGLSVKDFRRLSRGSNTDTQSTPFRYGTTRDLVSSYGMELRVKLVNNRYFGGSNCTLTFYGVSKTK